MGWGAEGAKYRFQWTFPIIVSPHDPNTIYAGSQVLHRSTDEGQSWQVISPDLTRNNPERMRSSGGPVTQDNTSVEYYCTIFALAESKKAKGLLWVGSDDGRVHVTRDGGDHWQDVTPKGMPEWSMISQIDPSPHDPGTAWLAVNRYKLDDPRPYAYVTRDYGKSWRSITGDLPADGFVRAVREDPVRKDLLFCGTERGLYWSLDAGAHWRPLRMNLPGRIADPNAPDGEAKGALPVVPITDLVVHDDDLIVATQGRSFWSLDHIATLRQSSTESANATAWLYTPGRAQMFGGPAGGGEGGAGANPLYGAVIDYRLAREPKDNEEITLEFLDASGKSLRKFSNKGDADDDTDAGAGGGEEGGFGRRAPRKIPAKAGLNRFAWDLRLADASRFKGLILWGGGLQGPQIVPGSYQVKLTAFGVTQTRSLEVGSDPRLSTTVADYQKRYDLHLAIRDKLNETHEAIVKIRDARDQIKAVSDRAKTVTPRDSAIATTGRSLIKDLTAVEEALYQTKNRSAQDPLNYPIRLNNKLANLVGVLTSADAPPTDQTRAVYQDVAGRIDVELAKLKVLLGERLTAFNRLVRDKEVPAVDRRSGGARPPRVSSHAGRPPDRGAGRPARREAGGRRRVAPPARDGGRLGAPASVRLRRAGDGHHAVRLSQRRREQRRSAVRVVPVRSGGADDRRSAAGGIRRGRDSAHRHSRHALDRARADQAVGDRTAQAAGEAPPLPRRDHGRLLGGDDSRAADRLRRGLAPRAEDEGSARPGVEWRAAVHGFGR